MDFKVGALLQRLFSSVKVAASLVANWEIGNARYTDLKLDSIIKYGWRRNELIFSCIGKTAKTASQVTLRVYRKSDGQELPDHPLRKLLQSPNPEMTEYDLWSSTIVYQMLAGRAVFEKERNRGGEVIRLWPLRPDWIRPVMLNRVQVREYIYQPPGVSLADAAHLRPEDVMIFRTWDPEGLFSTWPPAAVAARMADVDNDMTDLLKVFFQEGGQPMGLIKSKQKLRDDQVTLLRERWRARYGGWKNWIDPAVLDSDAEFQRVGLTFREMGFNDLDARSEARICMVLDTPPIIVGAKIGLDRATYANYGEARTAWWEDSLVPRYVDLLDTVLNHLLPDFADVDQIEAKWDFSKVPALQEDQNKRWERATSAWSADALTLNEFRIEIGLRPMKGPEGDMRKTEYVASKAPKPEPVQQLPAGDTTPKEPEKPVPTEEPPAKSNGHSHGLEVMLKSALSEDERAQMERSMAAQLVKYFQEQQARIKEEVGER